MLCYRYKSPVGHFFLTVRFAEISSRHPCASLWGSTLLTREL
jgi:hypothetical protein